MHRPLPSLTDTRRKPPKTTLRAHVVNLITALAFVMVAGFLLWLLGGLCGNLGVCFDF